MIAWFLTLDKRKKVNYILFAVLGLCVVILLISTKYHKNKWLKLESAKIHELELEKEGLKQRISLLDIEYDILERKKQKVITNTIAIETKIKEKQNETDNVPGAVALYTDTELDSAIRTYKHNKRAKN